MRGDLALLSDTYYPLLVIKVAMRSDMAQFRYAVRK